MNISSELSQASPKINAFDSRLTGVWRKTGILVWGIITLVSLVSLAYSLYSLNVWDRVPAAQQIRYFPDSTADGIQSHADYQDAVLQAGFSLSGYALVFTAARLLGSLALFIVGFLLLRRYSDRLMAVLMAVLLSVFAAAGIWGNPLFSWGAALAPWLKIPAGVLAWLLWCGLIVLYTFPDGRFTPRGTVWLAVLVVPLIFFMAFSINFFLNPESWPEPFDLLPNILFIGGGWFAVLYRYFRTMSPDMKRRSGGYVLGISLLMLAYFVDFFINVIYIRLTGQPLIQGFRAGMGYALVYEPLWYALEIGFAAGLAVSVFRKGLLEPELDQ
jgi:hypothetical protein